MAEVRLCWGAFVSWWVFEDLEGEDILGYRYVLRMGVGDPTIVDA